MPESKPSTNQSPEKPRKSGGRILELDAIRALTCLNLLLFHYTYVYQNKYGFESELGFSFPYGKYGVQLFFMLSGLVNALTLIKKRKPGEFIASRCIRIFPSYWLVIFLNVVLFSCLTMYNETATFWGTVSNLTTMPQLLGHPNMEPVTWTLQVEMLFYLFLMGTFALGLLDKPMRTMMFAITVCLVSCTFFDWFQSAQPESSWNSTFHFVDELFIMRTLPLFSMGILLNELRCKRGKPWQLWAGIVVSGVVFHLIDLREHNPLATILMMGMLTAAAYGKLPILRFKPLIFISFVSYPLYLFHNNLGSALMKFLESFGVTPLMTIVIATLFSIGVAAAVTYWFEQPITSRLRKLFVRRKPTPTVSGNSEAAQSIPASPSIGRVVPQVETGPVASFDSSECLDEVIKAESLMNEIRKDHPNEDALSRS